MSSMKKHSWEETTRVCLWPKNCDSSQERSSGSVSQSRLSKTKCSRTCQVLFDLSHCADASSWFRNSPFLTWVGFPNYNSALKSASLDQSKFPMTRGIFWLVISWVELTWPIWLSKVRKSNIPRTDDWIAPTCNKTTGWTLVASSRVSHRHATVLTRLTLIIAQNLGLTLWWFIVNSIP